MSVLSNCNSNELRSAIAGTLSQNRQSEIESHIEICKSCQQQLQLLAAEQGDWNKISNYFEADELSTTSYAGEPTVDIQLIRPGSKATYEVTDLPIHCEPNHAAILEPASHPEMLGRIDGFEIEQMIGQGGMGIVYKGFDTELNRPIAIKVLAQHLASNGPARQRFAREARAAAAVIHPNVVPIHSVNSSEIRPYIVMTLVSGRSLQAHISEQGPMGVKNIVRIGKQIAAGLSAAHREGLVHRDIKPANILLEKDVSRVMITDFGLARAADDAAITQTGWLAGTPHYMSPEQSTGKEIDQRSDLFSLGSVLYFMCTGREPFRAQIPVAILQKIASEEPDSLRSINSDITQTLTNIIERLLSKKPEHRFQSAEEVELILTQYLAHLEQPQIQPKPKFKKRRKQNASLWWLLLIPALIFMTLAPLLMYVWRTGQDPGKAPMVAPSNLGLMSHELWQQEIESLDRDLQQLESYSPTRTNPTLQPDPIDLQIDLQIDLLEASIQHIEQSIRNSN